jgi:hypothetical protein
LDPDEQQLTLACSGDKAMELKVVLGLSATYAYNIHCLAKQRANKE